MLARVLMIGNKGQFEIQSFGGKKWVCELEMSRMERTMVSDALKNSICHNSFVITQMR